MTKDTGKSRKRYNSNSEATETVTKMLRVSSVGDVLLEKKSDTALQTRDVPMRFAKSSSKTKRSMDGGDEVETFHFTKKIRGRPKGATNISKVFVDTAVGIPVRTLTPSTLETPTKFTLHEPVCTDIKKEYALRTRTSTTDPIERSGFQPYQGEHMLLTPHNNGNFDFISKDFALVVDDLSQEMLIPIEQKDESRQDEPKITRTQKHGQSKSNAVYVDACTCTEEESSIGKPFASVDGVFFSHPKLTHDLSILSWLSEQVDNEHFQIGVALPTAPQTNTFNTYIEQNKFKSPALKVLGNNSEFDSNSYFGCLFPSQASCSASNAEFLTTTVLLDPTSPALDISSTLPKPRLMHTSSAFSSPFSPFHAEITPTCSAATSSFSASTKSHSTENYCRTPKQSFEEALSSYMPVSSAL